VALKLPLWLILAGLGAGGCASYASRLGGRPLDPGAREWGLALDALVFEHGRHHRPLPVAELSYRRGLRPGVDFGGKLHLIGGEASLRFALATRGRLALAAAAGLGLGYEPVTNNTTDLIYARASPRLIAELAPAAGARWPAWIVAVSPSLSFTGPFTMFAGITGAARFVLRPGAAVATRWRLPSGRQLWLEVVAQPAYALGDGWLAPAFQGGAAISF
jgi:hypothetical protein